MGPAQSVCRLSAMPGWSHPAAWCKGGIGAVRGSSKHPFRSHGREKDFAASTSQCRHAWEHCRCVKCGAIDNGVAQRGQRCGPDRLHRHSHTNLYLKICLRWTCTEPLVETIKADTPRVLPGLQATAWQRRKAGTRMQTASWENDPNRSQGT